MFVGLGVICQLMDFWPVLALPTIGVPVAGLPIQNVWQVNNHVILGGKPLKLTVRDVQVMSRVDVPNLVDLIHRVDRIDNPKLGRHRRVREVTLLPPQRQGP